MGDEEAGQRVDSALAELAGLSRSQARRWIDEGRVRLDAKPCRRSQRVRSGAVIEASPPEPLPSPLSPEPISLAILHEDEDLIVVDKPAGLVVHPAPGHPGGTLVNALLHHCGDLAGVGGVLRPGIVHRLDQGTSGVLVAAKTDAAHRGLGTGSCGPDTLSQYQLNRRGYRWRFIKHHQVQFDGVIAFWCDDIARVGCRSCFVEQRLVSRDLWGGYLSFLHRQRKRDFRFENLGYGRNGVRRHGDRGRIPVRDYPGTNGNHGDRGGDAQHLRLA